MRSFLVLAGLLMSLLQLCSMKWASASSSASTTLESLSGASGVSSSSSEWQVQESGKAQAVLQELLEFKTDATTSTENSTKADAPTKPEHKKQCTIYMAPSSLKGLQGYGIFTTRDLRQNEAILQAPDGPSIVVTEFRARNHPTEDPLVHQYRRHWTHLWDHYWWGRGIGDHSSYEADDMIDFQPTFGALPNHHCLWSTIDYTFPQVPYLDHLDFLDLDNTTEDSSLQSLSVGAGAYSYHAGREFRVKRPLTAGSELFLNYGHCDRTEVDHNTPEWTLHSKMKQDYQRAAKLVLAIWNALYYYEATGTVRQEYAQWRSNRHQDDNHNQQSSHEGRNLMDLPLVEGILYYSGILKEEASHPVRSLIPTTTRQLFQVMEPFANDAATKEKEEREKDSDSSEDEEEDSDKEDGSSTSTTNSNHRFQRLFVVKPMKLAERLERILGTTPRTPDWIQQHGMCLEHLVPKPSTIPHAGQGAFAQHAIAKGDIVVPAPTLHILHRDVLQTNKSGPEQQQQQQHQLLLNYCWGNPQTTILLCPITNAQLINHCSDRPGFPCPKNGNSDDDKTNQHPKRGPNAKMEWATWDYDSTDEWRKMTMAQLMHQPSYQRGLSLQVVATRDIQPGEEVFVDYGVDWEQAWIRHVIAWNDDHHNNTAATASMHKRRRSVALLNQQIEGGQPLEFLVAYNLYADKDDDADDYLMTMCMYETSELDTDEVYQTVNDDWKDLDEQELLDTYADSGGEYVYEGGYRNHDEGRYWPCTVLRREETDDAAIRYTVRIHASPLEEDEDNDKNLAWHSNRLPRLLTHYPLASIRYFARMYHGDQHLPTAFRHSMGLPDEMIPEQWKTVGSHLH